MADEPSANKLTIYLLKSDITRTQDMVIPESIGVPIEGVGTFYYSTSRTKPPSWLRSFFGEVLNQEIELFSANTKGLLIVPIKHDGKDFHFALAFGHGRFLLKDGVCEERFGLKVVLNSADPDSLRSIDKTTLGSVPKHSREQMSRYVNASEFGIDVEQDLVSSVTAKSLDSKLGKMPSGRDALSVSVKIDAGNVVDFLEHCYARFISDDYKASFGWIDQICEVRDRARETVLKEQLAERLATRKLSKIWMAVPTLVEWADVEGFTYGRAKSTDLYSDIGMETFLDSLGTKPITAETLHDEPIFMVHASTQIVERWTAYQCTYAEIEYESKIYILTGGKWYEIARDFTEQVLDNYKSFKPSSIPFPTFTQTNEEAYNIDVAKGLGYHCMDRDTIMHGGGQSKIEFCDLLTPSKQLVHVKRYGASSVLSHLFAQGVTSGELFAADASFRKKVNDKLPTEYKLADPSSDLVTSDYEIVYAVISYTSEPLDIPFFSKVSLKNARRRLAGYGYKVSLHKIESGLPKLTTRPRTTVRTMAAVA